MTTTQLIERLQEVDNATVITSDNPKEGFNFYIYEIKVMFLSFKGNLFETLEELEASGQRLQEKVVVFTP